jgi:hypothetical protein
MDNSGFDINEEMLNTVFAYWTLSELIPQLTYGTPTNAEKSMMEVDESCILYNQLYKSFDFYDNKFPPGYENIPGFNTIIEQIVDRSQYNSPLAEYENRQINRDS